MAVHTEMRREIVENLAAFMRGEITKAAFIGRIDAILKAYPTPAPDSAQKDTRWDSDATNACCRQMLSAKDLPDEATIDVSATGWEALRHDLAFLQTDLQTQPTEQTRIVEARWDIVLCGLALTAVVVTSLWFVIKLYVLLLIVAWALFPPLTLLVSRFCKKNTNDMWNPFDDDQQWREHEHLVERLNLPAYSPTTHRTHWTTRLRRFAYNNVLDWRCWALSPVAVLLLLCFLAYVLVTGPIWVVLEFRRKKIPEQRAMPGEVIGSGAHTTS